MHLSPRLQAITDLLLPEKKLADIGTDHAYIPSFAVMTGLVPTAIASDINSDPVRAALETIKRLGLSTKIEVRLGPGLRVLSVDEVEQIVVAGMGGNTICDILGVLPAVAKRAARLVLQPMIRVAETRAWVTKNGYKILDEKMAEEDRHLYCVMALEPGQQSLTPIECEYGPILIARLDPLLKKLLLRDLNKTEQIIEHLSRSIAAHQKRPHYIERRNRILDLLDRWNQ
jgi:tRNA (adenine22-N1)-methyltransferase